MDKEKLFVRISIICIFIIIGIYAYRTIHFYRMSNGKGDSGTTLVSVITKPTNIEYNNDGLYKEEDSYYFKGKNVNNYVYYSGKTYRIISIGDTIKLIDNDIVTTMVYGVNMNFRDSYIYDFLNNKYLETLNKDYLVEADYCTENLNIEDYNCKDFVKSYVGLLTLDEYIKATANESYLNNSSYYWLLNVSDDNKPYYVYDIGGVNNDSIGSNSYYSYGVRPVINLKIDIPYISGTGASSDPYIIAPKEEVLLGDNYVGNYVKYNDYLFRIMDKNTDYVKMILEGTISNETEEVKVNYNGINNELTKFINNFNSEDLVKYDFKYNYYNNSTLYNYNAKEVSVSNNYIGLPIPGEFYITGYNGTWLNSSYDASKGLSYTINGYSIFADLNSNSNSIRPVIVVNPNLIVISGKGTKDNPLIIGGTNEENME